MKKLNVNPENFEYFSEGFNKGFDCGAKRQYEYDLYEIEQIRAEIKNFVGVNISDVDVISKNDVLNIIDKHINGKEFVKE